MGCHVALLTRNTKPKRKGWQLNIRGRGSGCEVLAISNVHTPTPALHRKGWTTEVVGSALSCTIRID
eukprot:5263915-Prymnesium_polylepis.2